MVSDTSPVRALHHLKRVDLLVKLYGKVWIPPAVAGELEDVYEGFMRLLKTDYPFIEVRTPVDQKRVHDLLQSLDVGEAQAIALALELRADHLLIDEREGRLSATQLGLDVTGVLGVLSRARNANLVGPVRPLLEELETGLRFFLSKPLKERTLKALGE